ncbi:MAG: hypothetical protein WCW14_01830 [Candidatus Paceibacterota bacterium]|jgi:uncharacterized protein YaaR (DUF327 family)
MEKEINSINDAELRIQQTEKIVDFLNKIGAYKYVQKILSNPEEKREVSFEEFRDFVVRLNGIARDVPIVKRSADGDGVYLSGFDEVQVPNHKDKEDILKDAYNSLGKIPSGDEAYLIPAVVNAVHLFADGNGRTSRILHTLLTKFVSVEDFNNNLRLAVGENGRLETEDINPGIVSTDIDKIVLLRHGFKFENEQDWSPIFPDGFCMLFVRTEKVTSKKAQEFVNLFKADQSDCFIAASEYLKEKGVLLQNVVRLDDGMALSPLKMEQSLSEEDWAEIMKRYYSLKKEHVEILIDSFVEPDKYKTMDGSMNLRNYFIKEIQTKLEKNTQ